MTKAKMIKGLRGSFVDGKAIRWQQLPQNEKKVTVVENLTNGCELNFPGKRKLFQGDTGCR